MKSNAATSITETYTLPSHGKLYEGVPESVTLRSMTTFEEKTRLGSSGPFFSTLSKIIDKCIVDNEAKVSSYDLASPDFQFLMYKLRTVTYGPEYKIEVQCPVCGAINKIIVNLDDLVCNEIDDTNVEPIVIGPLPRSSDTIECRYLSARDIDEIAQKSRQIRKKNPDYEGDPAYLLRLQRMILKINGESVEPHKLEKYVEQMPALDSRYLLNKYDSVKLGLDLSLVHTCTECDSEFSYILPFNDEFFRPTFD